MNRITVLTPVEENNDRGWGDANTVSQIQDIIESSGLECQVIVFDSIRSLVTELRKRRPGEVFFPIVTFWVTKKGFFWWMF